VGCGVALTEYGFPDRGDGVKEQRLAEVHEWAVRVGAEFLAYNVVSGAASADATYLLDSSPAVTAEFARQVQVRVSI